MDKLWRISPQEPDAYLFSCVPPRRSLRESRADGKDSAPHPLIFGRKLPHLVSKLSPRCQEVSIRAGCGCLGFGNALDSLRRNSPLAAFFYIFCASNFAAQNRTS